MITKKVTSGIQIDFVVGNCLPRYLGRESLNILLNPSITIIKHTDGQTDIFFAIAKNN